MTHKYQYIVRIIRGFPSSSAGKESTCNAGDPGLGRSLEKGRLPTPVFMGFSGGTDVNLTPM